jgi:hypothetical protein
MGFRHGPMAGEPSFVRPPIGLEDSRQTITVRGSLCWFGPAFLRYRYPTERLQRLLVGCLVMGLILTHEPLGNRETEQERLFLLSESQLCFI